MRIDRHADLRHPTEDTQVEVMWSLLVESRVEPAKRLLSRPRLGWLRSV